MARIIHRRPGGIATCAIALALLAALAAGREREFAHGIRAVADELDLAIPALEAQIPQLAVAFACVGRMFVIGRGAEFATARELALKLLETCRVAAQPLTATDLAHGPVAAVDSLFPVWTIASADAGLPAVRDAAARAREAAARLNSSGTAEPAFTVASSGGTPQKPVKSNITL